MQDKLNRPSGTSTLWWRRSRRRGAWACAEWASRVLCGLALTIHCATAQTTAEPLADLLGEAGSAGLGAVMFVGASPYRGAGVGRDLQPLYLYEGERLFLRADRIGAKWSAGDAHRFELFVRRRLEGFPQDGLPALLEGMAPRAIGMDAGAAWRVRGDWGAAYAALSQDIGRASRGHELNLGLYGLWSRGQLTLRPAAGLALRSRRLNDYYFGVRESEATAERPAYQAGAGTDVWLGLFGSYGLSDRWRALGGVVLNRQAATVRGSPIVEDRLQPAVFMGAVYGFGSHRTGWAEGGRGTTVKLMHGAATEDGCHLARIITLRCAELNRDTPTRITGIELGQPFIENLNGWPLDFVGYVGLKHHDDRPYQRNGVQVDLQMKAYWRGFPWSDSVRTRLGFGFGLSIADPVPYEEVTSQAARGRPTSRVLNYLDPTIDLNLGDVVGHAPLKNTWVGVGVSHRSGIFAWSKMLGSVNGGSNYIYLYVETAL